MATNGYRVIDRPSRIVPLLAPFFAQLPEETKVSVEVLTETPPAADRPEGQFTLLVRYLPCTGCGGKR